MLLLMSEIGRIYDDKDDLDQALVYYEKSKNIQENLGLEKTIDYAALINNIGFTYYQKNDLDQAQVYYETQ